MKEIKASGESPLTHYIENVLIELDGIYDASRGVYHEAGVTDLADLLARYGDCHKQWFRLALQELQDEGATTRHLELLDRSVEAHTKYLRTVVAHENGEATRDELDAACAESTAAVGELVYLTKPVEAQAPRRQTTDDRMKETIATNQESWGWSAQQWATHLGCSKSTVGETNTWRVTLKALKAGAWTERSDP